MSDKLRAILKIDTENSNKAFSNFFILVNLIFLSLSGYIFLTGNQLYLAHVQYHLITLILVVIPLKITSHKLDYPLTFKFVFYITYVFYIASSIIVNNQIDTLILLLLFTINLFGIFYLSKKLYIFSSSLAILMLLVLSYFPMLYRPERDFILTIINRITFFVLLSIAGYLALTRILILMNNMAEVTFNPFIDKLTGVYNKHYLNEVIKNINKSEDKQLSIIVADVDNMKQVITNHSYNTAEIVLMKLADIMRNSTRQSDSICRVEDDQFVVIAQHPKEFQVEQLAERIRNSIQNEVFTSSAYNENAEFKVTCSFGVVTLKEGEDSDELLGRAHSALKTAKEKGKNNIQKGQ